MPLTGSTFIFGQAGKGGSGGGGGTIEGSISAGNIPIGVGANTIASSSAIGATLSDASSVGINLNETGAAGLITINNTGSGGTTIEDSGGAGITINESSLAGFDVIVESQNGGVILSAGTEISMASGTEINLYAGTEFAVDASTSISIVNGGASGTQIQDTGGGGIEFDANGHNVELNLTSGGTLSIHGTHGVTAGPFTTITSITVINGIVTALTGA